MAPIFVGSNSDDTRIRSNRVGLAASTSDPGTASEGDIYYDSTNNQVKTYDGSSWSAIQGSGTVSGIASGTISNGATVIINTDGTVGVVTETTTDPSAGSAAVFKSTQCLYTSSAYDSENDRVVIAYWDLSNGEAVVGTVSGTSISFGTPVQFNAGTSPYIGMAFDDTNNKIVIAYRNGSTQGAAIVGTVSGTSISFGTEVVYESGKAHYNSVVDIGGGKVVIAYRDEGNSNYGTAVVGTVSGTSISFGTPVVFESASTEYISTVYDSSNSKVVITYRQADNSDYGTAIVGTVSGTSISFGTAVVFNSGGTVFPSATYDSTNGKVVIVYRDGGNSERGTAIVGTVSGTSISFGTAVVFNAYQSNYNSVVDIGGGKVVIAYEDDGNSSYGTVIEGTVSGTSISFGSELVFESANTLKSSAAYDSTNNKVVIAYEDADNSNYGTGIVITPSITSTNLTAENFIGFSDAAYSDGDTANIQIISSIDDAQSGLTTGSKFYVQNDGTLGIATDDPVVLAGTAVSGTEILIKQ